MVDRSGWDPEMAAFAAAGEEEAKAHPPIRLEIPLEPHRRTNDALSMRTRRGRSNGRGNRRIGGSRRVGGAFIAGFIGRKPTKRCRFWFGSMAAAGYGPRSIRMTGCAGNTRPRRTSR